jgi:hypothetical protein
MAEHISSLGELLNTAGTQWRVYDMGRRICKIDKQLFSQIEQARAPYPYPIGNHAVFAIQFWDNQATLDPYVWFLKFPLDEQSKLNLASRDHFANMVLEALGTEITGSNAQGKLDNNPYVITPNANKLATFNALLKRELNRPASSYYEYVELYFKKDLGDDAWQNLAIQGIADFCQRLDHGQNQINLEQKWATLHPEVKKVMSAILEHITIKTSFTELLRHACLENIKQSKPDELIYNLRAISASQANGLVAQTIDDILDSEYGSHTDILLTLAGRCWHYFEQPERLYKFLDTAAKNTQTDHLFESLFADLVAIPSLRTHVLNILRMESRSERLSRAIGSLFSQ